MFQTNLIGARIEYNGEDVQEGKKTTPGPKISGQIVGVFAGNAVTHHGFYLAVLTDAGILDDVHYKSTAIKSIKMPASTVPGFEPEKPKPAGRPQQ